MNTRRVAVRSVSLRFSSSVCGIALLAFLAFTAGSPLAVADEPGTPGNEAFPGSDKAPPDLPTTREAFTAPLNEPVNLPQWLTVLRTQIQRFETPPPTSPESTQLRDAWETILKPRIARMLIRLHTWEAGDKWAVVEGQAAPTVLKPSDWADFTRDMAQLATELHGAWQQYQNIEIRRKPGPPTSPQLMPRDVPITLTYPWTTLYRSVIARQQATPQTSWDGISYWHLLGRFRNVWDWTWERKLNWYRWLEARQAKEKFYADLEADLAATRDTLAQTLLGVQVFVGALQAAEENRMQSICTACRTDDATLREMAETALRDMALGRLEAERFRGDSYAEYGSLLRAWLRRQRAALTVLDVTEEPVAPVEPSVPSKPAPPDSAGGGSTGAPPGPR